MTRRAADLLVDQAPAWCASSTDKAAASGSDITAALDIALEVGRSLPLPGADTLGRWAALGALARANVTVARVVEAHTDALAVLAEANSVGTSHNATWGVFAAEGGDAPVEATTGTTGTSLTGLKPWCSLGAELERALITARVGDARGLYAIDLRAGGVRPQPAAGWVSRGLPTVVSVGLDLDNVPADPIGGPGWYLTRPGFAWGGMGVAACWHGAARGLADRLDAAADTELGALHRGRVGIALHASACVLMDAASRVDSGRADGAEGAQLALQVRGVVAEAVETVLREVGHALGPAPLAFDEAHAARVADLTVYVRQHHAERDLAALGRRCR